MLSAFAELCDGRNMLPEELKKYLETPLTHTKSLLDMTDEELESHYMQVEEKAENTQEDRALLILERAQEGRLERQAKKVFNQKQTERGNIEADQVPEMLESLRYDLSNTEVHFLLRKFNCTDGFDMIPEKLLTRRHWLWLVGECEMLKMSYKYITEEAFEICYEAMIQNTAAEGGEAPIATETWAGGVGLDSQVSAPQWELQPEIEKELVEQLTRQA